MKRSGKAEDVEKQKQQGGSPTAAVHRGLLAIAARWSTRQDKPQPTTNYRRYLAERELRAEWRCVVAEI